LAKKKNISSEKRLQNLGVRSKKQNKRGGGKKVSSGTGKARGVKR